jgi:hypothetical protein
MAKILIRLGGSCIIFTNGTKYLKDADELDTPRSNNELKEFKHTCSEYAKKFGYILAV